MSLFRDSKEPDAKLSMTRTVMFGFLGLAYLAVILGRDWNTVASIVTGGVGATLSKAWEVLKGNKESAPTT